MYPPARRFPWTLLHVLVVGLIAATALGTVSLASEAEQDAALIGDGGAQTVDAVEAPALEARTGGEQDAAFSALAPVYVAHDRGLPVHVWVGETRPRNQGAALTAWELLQHGVPHTVVADNAGGHLMHEDRVDLCITGSDRTTARGDVCNKIGTYLVALAARDNDVPFYVALPHSTIDWTLDDGLAEIPIEERDGAELRRVSGRTAAGEVVEVDILPDGSPVANPAFDVTPARLVTALVTERGVCGASREGLLSLYPEARERR